MSGWRARVLARRGLRRGHASREFSLTDLAEAVHSEHDENVYIDVDVFDHLIARGGPASAAINARLAPAPPLATALLCIDGSPADSYLSTLDLSSFKRSHTINDVSPTRKGNRALGSPTTYFDVRSPPVKFDVGSPTINRFDVGSPTTNRLDVGSPTISRFDVGSPTINRFDVGSPAMSRFDVGSPPIYDGVQMKLRLRLEADVEPLQEISVWFDEHTLAQIDMPFLTLRNITGKNSYTCHECAAEFEHPNALKIHLFMSCRSFEPGTFWATILRRLRAVAPTPDRLEALAAAWGRSRAGHICMYCGKLYSRKYGLKIHIRTHTGYKPLRCRHCARAFGDPSNLNKHVRLHAATDDAAYACALCGKRLARRRDLQRHLRSHHAN